MRKLNFFVIGGLVGVFGCASVEVKAPKEPIKMDITMRVDVYQHVVKDIDDIESIVSGDSAAAKPSNLSLVGTAHASDLDPAVEKAALRRKGRLSEVYAALSKGAVGENNGGLLTVRNSSAAPNTAKIVGEENSDRMIIFKSLAGKNGVAIGEIQKVYAERLQKSAPAGSPIQDPDGDWGKK